MRTKKYTDPQVSTSGDRWFVWFKFEGRTLKYYGGVNYTALKKSPKQRKVEIKGLLKLWESLLAEGFNPLTRSYETESGPESGLYSFVEALEYARQKKTSSGAWKKKTQQDYKSSIKFLTQAAHTCGLADTPIAKLRKADYKRILESVQSTRTLEGTGYNKYRDHLSSLIGEVAEWELIESNPVETIKMQPVIKKFAHEKPTPSERIKIVEAIKENKPTFYRFCSTLYGTTIREKEILALQIGDFHLSDQVIKIVPDKSRDNSKVLGERRIVIPDTLLKVLLQLNLEAFPINYYVFSKNYLPGPTRMHSNTPTSHWRDIVKTGLKIDKDLYGLKKLGGDVMIDIQAEVKKMIELPQRQMGHTTSGMTEVYVQRHIEIMNDLFRRNMPEL
jgi:integrase